MSLNVLSFQLKLKMCKRVNYVKWFYTGGYIYHSSTMVNTGQVKAMCRNLQQPFGKYYSSRNVFESTWHY